MRAIIIGAGDKPCESLIRKYMQGDFRIIAADGGGDVLGEYGIVPDIVMGDFDSISDGSLQKYETSEARVLRFPAEKDETDLELCADMAVDMGATDIVLLGVMGGRFDHTYAALLVLNRVRHFLKSAWIAHDGQQLCIVEGTKHFEVSPGCTFSVLPFLGSCSYTIEGDVKYPAKDLLLEGTRSVGNSNIAVSGNFSVTAWGKAIICINE